MNTHDNARSSASKVKLRDAFLRLRAAKEVGSVTVKELCQLAGVHRTTFYAHYADVYDLCDQIEDEYFCRAKRLLEANAAMDGIARFIRENAAFYSLYAAPGACAPLMKFAEILRPELEARSGLPRDLAVYAGEFMLRGLVGVWTRWILSGFSASEDDIALISREMFRQTARAGLI